MLQATLPDVMDRRTLSALKRIVHRESGISVSDGKEAMVAKRVRKRMRALDIADYRSYLDYVRRDRTGNEIVCLLDVMTTNVTSFFRQGDQFDFLKEQFARWIRKRQRRFRFWSTACSTGEEPYSLAMTFLEAAGTAWTDTKILATDLSTRALAACRNGRYTEKSIAAVPPELSKRYFAIDECDQDQPLYTASAALRRLLVCRRLNLSRTPFPMQGPFDVILCRNVMIYFDNELRRRLLQELYRLLKPGGLLLTGHAEGLTRMLSDFKPVRPSIYVRGA